METASESVEQSIQAAPVESSEYVYQPSIPPERMAWVVLFIAFVMFCLLSASTVLGIYFFLFESTVPIPTALQVAQGTVGITGADLIERVEREQEDLTNTVTSISTDSQSQATIQFRSHPVAEDEIPDLIAAVTLQRNTLLTFDHASRPRFEWSPNRPYIQLSQLSGQLDIVITGARKKPFLMHIDTKRGLNIDLSQNGRYRIHATDDEVRLLNLDGAASTFFADDAANPNPVPSGQEVVIRLGNRSIEIQRSIENILTNAAFSLQDTAEVQGDLLPPKWGCPSRIVPDRPPRGSVTMEKFDGRVVARLRRLDNATSSSGAGCVQLFGSDGLDVTDFDSIHVVATFNLNYQSLIRCGIEGSECPLMLLITYESEAVGVERRWFRGFYYDKPLLNDYPLRCDSCFQDHLNINAGVWYTFESDNLFTLLDSSRHPVRLRSIEFYASGHQFDTAISEMMILVSSSEAAPDAQTNAP